MIVERHLNGPMVSVEIGVQANELRVYMISGRRRCSTDETLDWGIDMPAWLSPEQWDACVEYSQQVVNVLGLTGGMFHLEMIVTAAGPVLVEANCRLMGGNMPQVYENLTGQSIYDDLFGYFLNRPLLPMPDPRSFGYSSSIRLETAEAGIWRHNGFGGLFPLADTPDTKLIYVERGLARGMRVSEGRIIGRIQFFAPDRQTIERRVDALFAQVEDNGGVRLLR
jgi:hypothetical protein